MDLATRTGWAIVDSDKKLLSYGSILLPTTKPPHAARFLSWKRELSKICKEHKPDLICIEELHMTRNLNTMKILCGLLAMTAVTAPKRCRIEMCHQGRAKKYIVKPDLGRAKLSKEDVFSWAIANHKIKNFNFKDHNDITDAILAAHWGLYVVDSYVEVS